MLMVIMQLHIHIEKPTFPKTFFCSHYLQHLLCEWHEDQEHLPYLDERAKLLDGSVYTETLCNVDNVSICEGS